MKLLLTSSGITNKSIEKAFSELVEKPFSKLYLTFIPTAANVEKGDKSWLVEDMYNFKKIGFSAFDVIDISAVSRSIWLPSFEKADILVFGGGNTFHLMQHIRESGLAELLPKLLKTRVYVGISAGSMVTAPTLLPPATQLFYYPDEVGEYHEENGLGLVDFSVRPHLNSKWFPKVNIPNLEKLSKETPNTFYAIDDGTAIKVVDSRISLISEGTWEKFN